MNVFERMILKEETLKFLKAHWPSIVAVLGGTLPLLIPGFAAIAAANPKSTIGILCAAILAAYNATAPKDQKFLNK